MINPFDISDIFTYICTFIGYADIIKLELLAPKYCQIIRAYPWSHFQIVFPNIKQFTDLMNRYNFKNIKFGFNNPEKYNTTTIPNTVINKLTTCHKISIPFGIDKNLLNVLINKFNLKNDIKLIHVGITDDPVCEIELVKSNKMAIMYSDSISVIDLSSKYGYLYILKQYINQKIVQPTIANETGEYDYIRVNISYYKKHMEAKLQYSYRSLDLASSHGHVDVLDLWLRSKYKLLYTHSAIILASQNGHVHVLKWWLLSGLKLKYTTKAMDYASIHGWTDVLDWWKNSGLKLKYTVESMDFASINSHFGILDWWKNSGLFLKYSIRSIDIPSAYGRINVLNWWLFSGLVLSYSSAAIDVASDMACKNNWICTLEILNWWKNSGLEVRYTVDAVDRASANGHTHILDWWTNSGLELKYFTNAMDMASGNGFIHVLIWWKQSGLELRYSQKAMDMASINCCFPVLEWWKDSGLELKYSDDAIDWSDNNKNVNVKNRVKILNLWIKLYSK